MNKLIIAFLVRGLADLLGQCSRNNIGVKNLRKFTLKSSEQTGSGEFVKSGLGKTNAKSLTGREGRMLILNSPVIKLETSETSWRGNKTHFKTLYKYILRYKTGHR